VLIPENKQKRNTYQKCRERFGERQKVLKGIRVGQIED
jgi:hypothetical protein